MKDPLVSTVITTYNRPKLLQQAIKSVTNQSYPNQEIIVVNDGGEKISPKTEKKFPSVQFIEYSNNKGLSFARNIGIKKSRGKYIAFLDDDDQWKKNKLSRQIKLAQSKDEKYGVFYCAQIVNKINGKKYINHPKIKGNISEEIVKHGLSTISSTNVFTRESLEKIGGFDEKLKSNIDHDIWMSLASKGYWADFIDLPLVSNSVDQSNRMIRNYQSRISSVERYIEKWTPTIKEWFGYRKGEIYIKNYYNYVIGWLAEEQFKSGKFKNGFLCLREMANKKRRSFTRIITTTIRCFIIIAIRFIYKTFSVPNKCKLFNINT